MVNGRLDCASTPLKEAASMDRVTARTVVNFMTDVGLGYESELVVRCKMQWNSAWLYTPALFIYIP